MKYIIFLLAMALAACKVSAVAICTLVGKPCCTPNMGYKIKYTWLRVFVPTLLTGVSVAVYYDKCCGCYFGQSSPLVCSESELASCSELVGSCQDGSGAENCSNHASKKGGQKWLYFPVV